MSDAVASLTESLESAFGLIHRERMADVPILNNKIGVNAVGFQAWQGHYLGVMITPWFMNLMLLPGNNEDWNELIELSKHRHVFPSGSYEFIVGYEAAIGKYQICSLFSPMFEFADNKAAIDTATAVMQELMNTENIDDSGMQAKEIETIWNGEPESKLEPEQELAELKPALSERIEKPISRRDLLRGAFRQDEAS